MLWWFITLFVLAQVFVALINLFTFPVLKAPTESKPGPKVSLLVPARNEAHTLPRTLPLLLQQGAYEVIVYDDQSDDDTLQVLNNFAGVKVLTGKPLPAQWLGKNWACQNLADAASGDVLVFTDADVFWQPGALAALCEAASAAGASFASVVPRQTTQTFWQRVGLPIVDLIVLSLYLFPLYKRRSFRAAGAGDGQCMFWRKSAYLQVGGHRAFKQDVVEDIRMGRYAKRIGIPSLLILGGELMRVEMYQDDTAMLAGLRKNIVYAFGGKLPLLFVITTTSLAYLFSWVFALFNPLWLVPAALGVSLRAITAYTTHRSPLDGFLQPLTPILLWRIAIPALQQRSVHWKGRDYPLPRGQ